MGLGRVGRGEWVFGVSALLLFGLMFPGWYGAELTNGSSSLLSYVQVWAPGKSGWESLGWIAVVLLATVVVALSSLWLRLMSTVRRPHGGLNAAVAILGLVSAALILFRIVDPPVLYGTTSLTQESVVELPPFLALAAAVGIATGGVMASREEAGFAAAAAHSE
jgi:hypothetical protein